jgi:hypothetical protein
VAMIKVALEQKSRDDEHGRGKSKVPG